MNACRDSAKAQLEVDPNINFFSLIDQIEKDSVKLVQYYIRLSGSADKNS